MSAPPQAGDVLLLALDPEGDVPEGWTRNGDVIWRVYDGTEQDFVDIAVVVPLEEFLVDLGGARVSRAVQEAMGWALVFAVGLVFPTAILLWVLSL